MKSLKKYLIEKLNLNKEFDLTFDVWANDIIINLVKHKKDDSDILSFQIMFNDNNLEMYVYAKSFLYEKFDKTYYQNIIDLCEKMQDILKEEEFKKLILKLKK